MKKIAGITWWKNNYGSILQAYALEKVIEDMGLVEYEILQQFSANAFSISSLFAYIKEKGLYATLKYIIKKFGNKKLVQRKQKCDRFVKKYMRISEKTFDANNKTDIENNYDGFICGSDQIWNPIFNSRDSIYWLAFDDSKYKLAYAPSIGVTEVTEVVSNEIRNALKSFSGISCREDQGTKLINSIIGHEKCITVLDPTLLIEKSEWEKIVSPRILQEKYVFSYVLRGTRQQRKLINKFAKSNNLIVVSIPNLDPDYYDRTEKKYYDIGVTDAAPQDFISLIKHAEYIFTDSFHCMIFSCLYHKTFFSMKKIGRNQMLRINDFQEWLMLGNRVVDTMDDVRRVQCETNDNLWKRFDERVKQERVNSMNYLRNHLADM